MKSHQLFVILFLLFVATSAIIEKPMKVYRPEPQLCLYTECRGQSRGPMQCGKGYLNCGSESCFITGRDSGTKTKCCTKSCSKI